MSEYYLHVGTYVKTVSLWKREGDKEHPIYANTRGKCEWFSFESDTYENTEPHHISDDLTQWLAAFHKRIRGIEPLESNRELPDLEWYERELLNAIGNPSMTDEVFDLLEWAYNEVGDE